MEWKEKFEKSNNRIKNDIKQKTKDNIDLTKQKIEHTDAVQFMKQKGFKAKASFVGNKIKDSKLGQTVRKIGKVAGNIINFIVANAIPIAIISGIFVFGTTAAINAIAISQALGTSPHYYCYLDPPEAVKNSIEYQQYCQNDATYIKMDSVNGHYVVQDGPGPCVSCSVLNMLIRFYYANNINIYNYLWQSNGTYAPIGSSIIANRDEYNLRLFVTGSDLMNDSSKWAATNIPNGSKEFAENHGKKDYTMANWGYLRDPAINVTNGYPDLSTNDNWVWDLSLENDAPGTDWSAQWYSGNNVTIEGTKATFVQERRAFRSLEEFKILLDAHPAGIVVYRQYAAGQNHGILVTGYNESTGTFMVVDPALSIMGGYETSADMCAGGIFNNAILSDPAGSTNGFANIIAFAYIEQG